ncbi:MAG TPA: type VI secretion system contractile sheath small subunit [Pseudomonadota bacterium]|jgi:type VI secretion system protein ImpB|nr:type VI secretion system contractile sheath small subunit [Pseudomonadota bacterium]HND11470.1 type VI secretion system contractile sheath small subunit [Pseudomonadota bacterium]HNF99066.1 type VI secretion system contractile sheath small subunit [Pseudomonadota bacterium]HNK43843.1 type VI secretion system contractile sheath small subunit [Pseudomonadota bacterium]HNN49673.1 type VI secretion system contractile sheath small subunit [Pseudomonadota bacterium]
MSESTQHKLDRVRPPRVQITYDVEIGGAIQMKELPFVVGILADLAGQQDALPKLKDRKFTQIDRDNFNQVLANVAPKLKYSVPNQIQKEGKPVGVDLTFHHLDDFHPTSIVKNVPQLRELLEMRQRLVDLLTKLDGNDDLQTQLAGLLADKDKFGAVKALAAKSAVSS